jgi:Fic family protein
MRTITRVTDDMLVSSDDIREIDAQYRGFPPLATWPHDEPAGEVWSRRVAELEAARSGASAEDLAKARQLVMRMAAIDTGAIEGLYSVDRGFTITVATQAAAWEAAMEERGVGIRPLFEAQLRAYELVLDAATQRYPVSEAWIRRLHEEVCAAQDSYTVVTPVGQQEQPLPKGQYKLHPNHVALPEGGFHAYASVEATPSEMHRLIEELTSERFSSAHPVVQAAFAHYGLVAIHPFADGNGRVARALASVYLYRAASIPLLLFADRRLRYFGTLSTADRGDLGEFVAFVLDAALEAIAVTTETLRTVTSPDPTAAAIRLGHLLTAQGGLTFTDMDRLGANLAARLADVLRLTAERLPVPAGVTIGITRTSGSQSPARTGFRPVIAGQSQSVLINVAVSPPAGVQLGQELYVLVSKSRDDSETICVDWPDGGEQVIFGLNDVHPDLSAAAEHRLETLAERVLGAALDHVTRETERLLSEQGYLGQ